MLGFLKGLLGIDSVVNSATKIIDKIAGTDWTTKERAQFILDYQNATKHQSVARRLIALVITFMWVVLCLAWVVSVILGLYCGVDGAIDTANQIKIFASDTIKEPFNYIIMFYYGVSFAKTFSK